jgi:hypothetical protein
MLRRAENCEITVARSFFGKRSMPSFHIGRETYELGRFPRVEWEEIARRQLAWPIFIVTVGTRAYWWFEDRFYWDNDELEPQEIYALLRTRAERERARIDRAVATVTHGVPASSHRRGAIPEDVAQFVFSRDGGRCCACGSTAELQFDHVIPVALGGSSAAENLQVLCGPCNRRKGAGLTAK